MLYHFCFNIFIVFSVKSIAKASSLLQSRLLGDRNQWHSAVMTWSRLQGELAASRNADKTPRTALREKVKKEGIGREDQNKEEGKCILESRKRTRELTEEESENKRLRSDEQNGSRTLKGEREEDNNREAGEEGLQDISVVNNLVVVDTESSREKDGEQNESDFKGIRSGHTATSVSFRINCKCSGSLSRCLSPQVNAIFLIYGHRFCECKQCVQFIKKSFKVYKLLIVKSLYSGMISASAV